jgi:hypothetical protein
MPSPFRVDDVITNGSSAGKVIEVVEHDPTWNSSGVRIQNIGLELYGGNVGMSSFVPSYLLSSYHLVPFQWTAAPGGHVEIRYTWSKDYRRLTREVRRVES